MHILEKYLPFIKEQVSFQQRAAAKGAEKPTLAAKSQARADMFDRLYRDIEQVIGQHAHGGPSVAEPDLFSDSSDAEPKRPRLTLLPADLEGLPEELIKQLSINNESDRQELFIVELLDQAGGIMSLDQLIIALWKQRKEIFDRSKLNSKLYRMTQKQMVFNIGKGVYSTKPVDGSFDDSLTESSD